MPSNKNQHFLPQHYLRLFALEDGKNIGIARIEPFKFAVGPIKGQCQADWFYREDGQLDDWLQETETAYGGLLPQILAAKKLTNEQLVACRFLAALFFMRTKKAAEIHGLFSRKMFFDVVNDGIAKGEVPPPPPDWSMETVGVNGVSGFLVKNMLLQCFFEMETLHCKLLEPAGSGRFVTSDHPVVCLNQLFSGETKKTKRCYVGFSRSGFQLMLPLCSTLCLFFYDPKVYKVGNRRDYLVRLEDSDVELLNSLQVQNADACVYTADGQSATLMESLVRRFATFRVPTLDLLKVTQNDNSEFFHLTSPNLTLPRPWSFCKLQSNPRVPESKRRNDAWTAVVEAFVEHVDRTQPKEDVMEEFLRFIENYAALP